MITFKEALEALNGIRDIQPDSMVEGALGGIVSGSPGEKNNSVQELNRILRIASKALSTPSPEPSKLMAVVEADQAWYYRDGAPKRQIQWNIELAKKVEALEGV